ncbi:MAG: FAD-dependent oxidoreductase [Candidatus Devosia phytovorans]|uniref:FAD-dependent oxidoreductase n=1 Tax=Candidatus Devosia phytovorans TaxID=3121372 RepID=A0AAJ5VS23_9HYPH|nr:FAD-dependent oxidoreductase [Devosia sp.]WEK03763.1 MAG: FAD-dependent oxidoreductase [Devosia sp.]
MRRIVILGGGYAGLHAFSALRTKLRSRLRRGEVDVTLISREGYHTYHGWTGEVLTGHLPVSDTLTPLEPMLGDNFVQGEVVSADLPGRALTVQGADGEREIRYDHLVIAAGSVDPFDRIPGLAEHGWCVKDTLDMQALIGELDRRDAAARPRSVVVVGGGPAGVETASALAARFARDGASKVNIHLVSSSDELLPSMRPAFNHMADKAEGSLLAQGVQVHRGARVSQILADHVALENGETISADMAIVAAGVSYKVLRGTEALPRNAAGQILANDDLRVRGSSNVWVAGDLAGAAHPVTGEACPTNALWAMAQGDCVGANIARAVKGKPVKRFGFKGLGQTAGLAGQRGITELYGMQFTGRLAWVIRILFFAWFMPSRSHALSVVMHLSQTLWGSVRETASDVAATATPGERPAPVPNATGRLR